MIFHCSVCGQVNRVSARRVGFGPLCGTCKAVLKVDGATLKLSDDQLKALLEASPIPVVVDFYADWCPPCKVLSPILQQLGRKRAGQILVVEMDTERHSRTARDLGVQGLPAVFIFLKGQVVDRAAGVLELAEWDARLAPHLVADP